MARFIMKGSWRVFWSIFKANRDLPLLIRSRRAYEKTLLYGYHYQAQQLQLQQTANKDQKVVSLVQQNYNEAKQFFTRIFHRLKQFRPQAYIPFNPKTVSFQQIVGEVKSKQNTQKLFEYVLSTSVIFYNSIQALVEGRREVLSDPQLKLWDGETVHHKEEKFEIKVKYIIDRINVK